jgi:cyanophycinase
MGRGPLALVGGSEFGEECTFDEELVGLVGATEVVILPAASAYENRAAPLAAAAAHFDALGVGTRVLDVYSRGDALDESKITPIAAAKLIYILDGSPMHLRAVLKDSPLWEAVVAAWRGGAALAGSGSGGDVLCDHMVDSRGGAFTVGLGLVTALAMIPRYDSWSRDKVRRTVSLAPSNLAVVGIDEQTALISPADGTWLVSGAGGVEVFEGGEPASLDSLPACE